MDRMQERYLAFQVEIGAVLNRNTSLSLTLQACVESIVYHLEGAFARIWTLNSETDMLELQASAGLYTHLDGSHSRIPLGQFKIGLIAAERKPHLTNNVIGDPRVSEQEWAKREEMVAFAGYPLVIEDDVIGVMAMFARKPLTEETLRTLGLVADMLAQTILRKRTEQALYQSEERFRTTLQSIGDAVIATDAEGRITFMNAIAEHLTGWTIAEATGKVSRDVFHIINEQTRREVQSPVEQVLREGVIVGLANHTVLVTQDGREYPIEDSGAPITDDAGKLVGVVLVFHDVTESRRKERTIYESQERTRRIIETALDAVVEIGEDSRIIGWNPQAEQIFGWSAQEVLGCLLTETILPVEYRQAHLKGMAHYLETREGLVLNTRFEIVALDRNGREFPIELAITPIKTGEVTVFSAFIRDITERVEHIREVEELNARLHRSIQETHHRVKNNLQIISALAELQIAEGEDTIPASALYRIGQHTRSLAALHDILTQQSKANAQTDAIPTQDAMHELIPLLQATTRGRHIRYQVADIVLPVRIAASFAMLVAEIISNAIKHGTGDINLTLTTEGDNARLEICDDGPGFPPDFDWKKAANTGLSLIESAGSYDLRGTIAFENREEGGARVVVVFPLSVLKSD